MDFNLSEDLIAVRDLVRDFAEKEITPAAAKDDREHTIRSDLYRQICDLRGDCLCSSAVRILGAYGHSTEFPVGHYLRDAKSYQIVEGSTNIQKLIIAQDALGYKKANR